MPEINFFWDPLSDNILQERDETGAVTAEYTAEPGLYGNIISQNRGGAESQFHYDAQGSTLAVTDDNQNVTDTFAYTAFGEVTERTGTTEIPFQYIGRQGYYRDSLTGQYLVRRRVYEPIRARWLSADSLWMQLITKPADSSVETLDVQEGSWILDRALGRELSWYAYAGNSAPNMVDPSGMLECIPRIVGGNQRIVVRFPPIPPVVPRFGRRNGVIRLTANDSGVVLETIIFGRQTLVFPQYTLDSRTLVTMQVACVCGGPALCTGYVAGASFNWFWQASTTEVPIVRENGQDAGQFNNVPPPPGPFVNPLGVNAFAGAFFTIPAIGPWIVRTFATLVGTAAGPTIDVIARGGIGDVVPFGVGATAIALTRGLRYRCLPIPL